MTEKSPMHFRGYPADVVIEIKMRHGTLRVKVGDLAQLRQGDMFGKLRIPIGMPFHRRLHEAVTEAKIEFGP